MNNRSGMIKLVASVVIGTYFSMIGVSPLAAAEVQRPLTPIFLAQASPNASAFGRVSVEEERALRQIYDEKIQRLEGEMNNARGSRNTLLTVAVTTMFLGGGILASSGTVSDAVKEIEVSNEQEEADKEDALNAIDALTGIGGGIVGVGGASLLGYLIYTGIMSSKQHKIDQLREELNTRFAVRGLTPEYLQKNESVAVVLEEIANAKKSAGTARSFQGFFLRIAIGALLSGGFLALIGSAGEDVIKEVNIDPEDPEEIASRDDALDQAENIKLSGLILVGGGATCGILGLLFGHRASGKEKRIDELENSLLRVASRLDWQPKPNGIALMYSYNF